MSAARLQLARRVCASAHFTGSFRLRSGRVSDEYFDMIVEDVVSTGGQIAESCRELRALGAIVEVAVCAIDRESGGVENLARESIELRSLLTMTELRAGA